MRSSLIERINAVIGDFDDVRLSNPDHVDKWVSQFSEPNQLVVLQETASLLERYYLTEEQFKGLLDKKFLEKLDKGKPYTLIQHDRLASSREYFTSYANQRLPELGFSLTEDSRNYLLVDDCLFSGNTLIREIEEWLNSNYVEGISITIILHSFYKVGVDYLSYRLRKARDEAKYDFTGQIYACTSYDNRYLMMPRATSPEAQEYFQNLEQYRSETQSKKPLIPPRYSDVRDDKLFSSHTSRDIFEQEMLSYGIKVVDSAKYPIQNSKRPMGFDTRLSFGFGAFYCNFRNVSNNCPLALWYKFEDFYSLLDRKVR